MDSTKPIVAVIGSTGTGKSKLAIEIAKKYNGEVINADAMQMYKGLDIVTNKVTESEQDEVKHHLINFLDPLHSFTILEFRSLCLSIIEKLHKENKLPVIVGGTHYYVEAILYKNTLVAQTNLTGNGKKLIEENPDISKDNVSQYQTEKLSIHPNCNEELASNIILKLEASNKEDVDLYSELLKIDAEYGSKLHSNNKRKIYRALQIWVQTGMKMSEHIRLQKSEVGQMDMSGTIRFPNTAVLWVDCDKEILLDRLNKRVDTMIENGLIEELKLFHESYNQKLVEENIAEHYERGIFQSIGFKEFHDFLILPNELQNSKKGQKLFARGVEKMNNKTCAYAKYQLKWINKRLVRRTKMALPFYKLDTTEPSKWSEVVSPVADDVVSSLLTNTIPNTVPVQCTEEDRINAVLKGDQTIFYCDICSRQMIGQLQWDAHMKGRKHKSVVNKRKSECDESESNKKCAIEEESSEAIQNDPDVELLEKVTNA